MKHEDIKRIRTNGWMQWEILYFIKGCFVGMVIDTSVDISTFNIQTSGSSFD